jgi:serine/threonine protein kinase
MGSIIHTKGITSKNGLISSEIGRRGQDFFYTLYISDTLEHNSAIVTEFAGNGSLASHLPSTKSSNHCRLSGANRITRIIVGIVLAMRYLHSHDVIHRDLNPDNILLDWDWTVRIADFGHSSSPENPRIHLPLHPNAICEWPSGDSRYLAPECYDNSYFQESDVFSFGMILYELLVGQRAFPNLKPQQIAHKVVINDERPTIPEFVLPSARNLITDCWSTEPGDRASFDEIMDRLKQMKFKVIPGVNPSKLSTFVEKIEELELRNATIQQ